MGNILQEGKKEEELVVGTCGHCGTISEWQRKEKIYLPPPENIPVVIMGTHVYKCPKCEKTVYAFATMPKEEYLASLVKTQIVKKESFFDKIKRFFKA